MSDELSLLIFFYLLLLFLLDGDHLLRVSELIVTYTELAAMAMPANAG
jgi:hypothetical protein